MALPLVLSAIQGLGGVAGAIQGNQQRQRAKQEINDAYAIGQERLRLRQGDVRQGTAEGLVARGLAQGGNARVGRQVNPTNPKAIAEVQRGNEIAKRRLFQAFTPAGASLMQRKTAMEVANNLPARPLPAVVPRETVTGARDLGGQVTADLRREQQLEANAMQAQRDAAIRGVNTDATANLVGNIGQAIAGGIQGYQTGQTWNSYRGVDPVQPLLTPRWDQGSVDRFNTFNQTG